MTTKEYIESGILEIYVLGSASEAETRELLQLKQEYPEIQNALYELETDLERIARHLSIPPPPDMLARIEYSINNLIITPDHKLQINKQRKDGNSSNNNQFIEVEAESSQMRVHKNWKWVFAAVFILSKIFLIASIYFYLENRQAQQQIKELKAEIKQISK